MKKSILIPIAALALWSLPLNAQEYFEATGQTAIFTLSSGLTATQPANTLAPSQELFTLTFTRNGPYSQVHISGGIPGTAKLYQLNGRMIGFWPVGKSGILRLNRHFSSQAFLLRFEPEGNYPAKTIRLPVMLEGGRS
ncbi:MAG: hypothetical protein MUF22_01040 [Chitinispirillaceae bacterium]|jgi:hypothetical protein|nr:hypothetical protein [Chitinispirillaceae bacterium]